MASNLALALDLPRVYFDNPLDVEITTALMGASSLFRNYTMTISDERVGEWGLVKKMSIPAHVLQSFDRINTFLAIIYDCFCRYAFCLAIFAA